MRNLGLNVHQIWQVGADDRLLRCRVQSPGDHPIYRRDPTESFPARISVAGLAAAWCLGFTCTVFAGGGHWASWEELPVYHNGRVMPLVTFAEETVELICGRANPLLGPERPSPEIDHLFPNGAKRRFSASELIFSWIVEPELWEDIPFLRASHEELRELLGLPLRGEGGERLLYAPPRVVAQSVRFRENLRQISKKVEGSTAQRGRVPLTPFETSCQRLAQAYRLFRMVIFRSRPNAPVPEHLWEQLVEVSIAFRECRDSWRQVGEVLAAEDIAAYRNLGQHLTKIQQLLHQLVENQGSDNAVVSTVEVALTELRRTAAALESEALILRDFLFNRPRPEDLRPEEWQQLRAQSNRLVSAAASLRGRLRNAHLELYEAEYALRVVPALDPGIGGDGGEEDCRVWYALSTVLDGSPYLWAGVPEEKLRAVRDNFGRVAEIYRSGAIAKDPRSFTAQLEEFSLALGDLGRWACANRKVAPTASQDDEFWRLTSYPHPKSLRPEIMYHRLQPFFWACFASGVAVVGFGLSFGVTRKLAFVVGVVGLLGAAAFVGVGLMFRAQITGYVPVTNMFETVVFVAMVTAILGLWIVLWPWFGVALLRAWRMTAIPSSFEATALTEQDLSFAPARWWNRWGWINAGLRLLLGIATLVALTSIRSGSKGGEPVFYLLPPVSSAGVMLLNDWVVWLVGLSVVLVAAWFVPRVLLTVLFTPALVPFTLKEIPSSERWKETSTRLTLAVVSAAVTLLAALVAYLAPISGKRIAPLMPVLRDNFWLALHVLTITASYGAGALVWGLANLSLAHFLLGRYQLVKVTDTENNGGVTSPVTVKLPPEACLSLARFMYRGMQVAVLLLAAGTIFGGLWADVSWGRFWGWDSKEVWALIALLVYLGILHGRLVGMLNEFGLAVGAIVGATAIIVAWYGVNFVFGSGLHSYGEGAGGGAYVTLALVANWIFVAFAWMRYRWQMSGQRKAPLHAKISD